MPVLPRFDIVILPSPTESTQSNQGSRISTGAILFASTVGGLIIFTFAVVLLVKFRYRKAKTNPDTNKYELTLPGVGLSSNRGLASPESSIFGPTRIPSAILTPRPSSVMDFPAHLRPQRSTSISSSRSASPIATFPTPGPVQPKEAVVRMEEDVYHPLLTGAIHPKEILAQREKDMYDIPFAGAGSEPRSWHPKLSPVQGRVLNSTSPGPYSACGALPASQTSLSASISKNRHEKCPLSQLSNSSTSTLPTTLDNLPSYGSAVGFGYPFPAAAPSSIHTTRSCISLSLPPSPPPSPTLSPSSFPSPFRSPASNCIPSPNFTPPFPIPPSARKTPSRFTPRTQSRLPEKPKPTPTVFSKKLSIQSLPRLLRAGNWRKKGNPRIPSVELVVREGIFAR